MSGFEFAAEQNSFESRCRISEITCFFHMLQRSKACWKRSRLYPQQFPFYDEKNEATFVKKKKVFSSQCDSRMLWMKMKLHITLLLWTCGAFLLSNIFLFHKNFTSMIMTNCNKPGGGHEMLARTINYCERRLPRCAPDQTPTTGAPPPRPHPLWPHASSLNNFSALLRWHLVAYFLSYPFISCHFFGGISSCSG